MKRTLLWLLFPLALGLFLAVACLPLPAPPYLDFQVIYHADMGLLRGIPLYDHAGQVKMIADLAGVQAEQVFVLPFPYPPWYALAALPLAFLPISVAARLWMELNVFMLMLSVLMLTEGWESWKRLTAFPLALLFLPVLGALVVGQYTIPVFLGIALTVYALRHEKPLLTALAAVLLTFKPHLGGLILLAVLLHLWLRRDAFGLRAMWTIIAAFVFLFAVGFLADPAWPLNYVHSLFGFKDVSQCNGCASLPMTIASLLDLGLDQAIWVAGGLLLGLVFYMLMARNFLILREPRVLVATSVSAVLLVSPYLQNYDFVLLLLPIIVLAGSAISWIDWGIVGTAYFLPWFGLGLLGRQGNPLLILSTVLLAGWLYRRTKKMLDLPISAMYNQKKELREE